MPTNRPESMMMMSERAPVLYTCATIRRGRASAGTHCASRRPKKSAVAPRRRTPALRKPALVIGEQLRQKIRRRVMKRHRSIGAAGHELAHRRGITGAQLRRRTCGGDHAAGEQIAVVGDV